MDAVSSSHILKVSLVLLTLNENDGMRAIMPLIKPEWYDELIVMDGGSDDGTVEYCRMKGYPIYQQTRPGGGEAFREAFDMARGDIVVMFSPDGNSLPEKIPELVNKIKEGYDIVIASRYLDGAKSYDDDPVTRFGNKMFTWLVNKCFKAQLTDVLVMYRAYRRRRCTRLIPEKSPLSIGTVMLINALRYAFKITEIPADEPARIGGVRKMQPLKYGWCELTTILKERFAWGVPS